MNRCCLYRVWRTEIFPIERFILHIPPAVFSIHTDGQKNRPIDVDCPRVTRNSISLYSAVTPVHTTTISALLIEPFTERRPVEVDFHRGSRHCKYFPFDPCQTTGVHSRGPLPFVESEDWKEWWMREESWDAVGNGSLLSRSWLIAMLRMTDITGMMNCCISWLVGVKCKDRRQRLDYWTASGDSSSIFTQPNNAVVWSYLYSYRPARPKGHLRSVAECIPRDANTLPSDTISVEAIHERLINFGATRTHEKKFAKVPLERPAIFEHHGQTARTTEITPKTLRNFESLTTADRTRRNDIHWARFAIISMLGLQ